MASTIIELKPILASKQSMPRRIIVRAVEIAGHEEILAGFLGLSGTEVKRWLAAKSDPATNVFLVLLDIVAANSLTPDALFNRGLAVASRG